MDTKGASKQQTRQASKEAWRVFDYRAQYLVILFTISGIIKINHMRDLRERLVRARGIF